MEVSPHRPRTILITGGAGFIGSHLCRKYIDDGHTVYCVDNLQVTGSTRNIDNLMLRRTFHFIKHDITQPLRLPRHADVIINCACPGSYTSYQYDPVHTLKTNTTGIINLLELARKHGALFLQTSTSEIYGDPSVTPQSEQYWGNVNPTGPRACYDEGKRCAETLCVEYRRQYDVDARIIRIFNTYGPGMDPNDGRAVSNFIGKALSDEPLIVYGSGTQTRSFMYVDDLVRGIDAVIQHASFQGPVNLGNPGEVSMNEFAERIIEISQSKSPIQYDVAATDDPQRRCPDITLAKDTLKWEPRVTLDEGLAATIGYFRTLERPDAHVLVFATTYAPVAGPAEKAFEQLAAQMIGSRFDVITTRFVRGTTSHVEKDNVRVHRLGIGHVVDKYLLPITGSIYAARLTQRKSYHFVWALGAGYAALAAFIFKAFHRETLILLTVDSGQGFHRDTRAEKILAPLYRFILRRAHTVYVHDLASGEHLRSFVPDEPTQTVPDSPLAFMHHVRTNYQTLLNRKQGKLDRPR